MLHSLLSSVRRVADRLFVSGRVALVALILASQSSPSAALDAAALAPFAEDEIAGKVQAIDALVGAADARAPAVLRAMREDRLLFDEKGSFFIQEGDRFLDAVSGAPRADAKAEDLRSVTLNNRIRGRLDGAIAAFALVDADRANRAKAIDQLERAPDPVFAKLVEAALAKETDAGLKSKLELVRAGFALRSPDRAERLAAIRALGDSDNPRTRLLLLPILEKNADGSYKEADADLRRAAELSLGAIDRAQKKGEWLGAVLTGISLGSILLLAALGLAITYGLMGVINMAHGEFLMIGAYATYVVQGFYKQYLPGAMDWYLLAALPVAFAASALIGFVLERSVIRFLYGRPLETLLATYGISLLLIQITRNVFGAQNVEVANPAWMSGGVQLLPNLILPYSRIYIVAFSIAVVAVVWAVLNFTRLGLFVRAVTQNRAMAGCVGVRTRRVDALAFSLGAGIAGLGGVALSQIGNVGPDLGQSYIVDSFMVVVLGGVGQLAGTVLGALILGIASKFLEPVSGAVLAKIMVLVFIILFIQKRPQGLFALKGRSVEA
jgi:urea transport system permease protein